MAKEGIVDPVAGTEDKHGVIPDEGEFCVYGTVFCKPEHAESLHSLYQRMTKIAATEPGIIYYSLSRNSKDPSIFHFFERYASKQDFERHTSREETQTILKSGWFDDVEARFERPIMP